MRKTVANHLNENKNEWIDWVKAEISDSPEIKTFQKYVDGVLGCAYGDIITLKVLATIFNIKVIVMRPVGNDTCIAPKEFKSQVSGQISGDPVIIALY